jgi:hypothetical protein
MFPKLFIYDVECSNPLLFLYQPDCEFALSGAQHNTGNWAPFSIEKVMVSYYSRTESRTS